jgi:hypothetical protein
MRSAARCGESGSSVTSREGCSSDAAATSSPKVSAASRPNRGIAGIGQAAGVLVEHVADPERVHVHDHERGRAAAVRARYVDRHDATRRLDVKPL